MTPMGSVIRRKIMITFIKDDNGATAIEYGLILGLLAGIVSIYFGLVTITTHITDTFAVI